MEASVHRRVEEEVQRLDWRSAAGVAPTVQLELLTAVACFEVPVVSVPLRASMSEQRAATWCPGAMKVRERTGTLAKAKPCCACLAEG